MNSFKFFIGFKKNVSRSTQLCRSFANQLIQSGEWETTIYPKRYEIGNYSLLVEGVTVGVKINSDSFEPYVEQYHKVVISCTFNGVLSHYQFRV